MTSDGMVTLIPDDAPHCVLNSVTLDQLELLFINKGFYPYNVNPYAKQDHIANLGYVERSNKNKESPIF